MDLDRLSEFAAVARGGNIKAVAQELGVPPATLSARLRGFEKELGMELFRRVAGGLALTEAGERLLPSAEEILASLRQLRGELKEAERHRYSRLRIGITGSGLPLYLGPFLDELNLKYPDISLELLDDSRYSIEEGLRSGEVDIYFASVMRDFEIPGLTKTRSLLQANTCCCHASIVWRTAPLSRCASSTANALYPTPAPGKTAFVISSSAASKPPG